MLDIGQRGDLVFSNIANHCAEAPLSDLNPDDAALVARIGAGDRDALAEAYHAYGGAVKSLAYRVLRDMTLAEDVVQETLVSLWQAPEKYDPARASLRTYLLTIGHRRAVDTVRSEQARSNRQERQQPPDPRHYDLEDEVWVRRLGSQVREALTHLSEDEQRAISLAYFGGLSYVEVARQLDAPEGTVKSRIRSGMKKLAVTLEGVV